MNEEEIINEIGFCLSGEWISLEHEQAIKGLLDLYKQEKEKNKKMEEQINDLSNRIMQGIYHIEETCIAKNEDGTKREIASIGDLEELEDILGGKYLYE